MDRLEMKAIIEGLLFISGEEGIDEKQIAEVLQIEQIWIKDILHELVEDYCNSTRGLQIVQMAGLYQFTTKQEHALYFKRLINSPNSATLSQAALETLAIVAYKQPITRAEVEEIRGVKSERPLHTLIAKLLIKEVGRVEGTGRAILYGTTKEFLDHFGLKSLQELPPLPEKELEVEEADLFFERFQKELIESDDK
ncbi:SMC-Scp complex subunit ScpB [Anaerobacillus isosaccharinicus]|uniref:Segregation and condensation protein B n=1 Tax=Anaerobacillus isosaccharinicus TaxID=1532552 RepID=A0A1S2M3U9_9BACI|nr:SMC-Scp complex subunit ScpB [Anaerobacillus isosaccharinicus]MBA5585761.1 SMC-Scp complex subunit ScpB [Anaerobacillus isosaccharinicus]QOY35939.1 SMC-Scp complex subunit ScpB [Anaerobacillus isosaccharinicus]